MAQITKNISVAVEQLYEQFDYDEAVTLTTSFAKVLTVNCTKVRESIFHFKHDAASAETVDYKIFGSAQYVQDVNSADPESDDGWVNLLSTGAYDHATEKVMISDSREFDALSNPWKYIIIMAKESADESSTLKIWHRGQS